MTIYRKGDDTSELEERAYQDWRQMYRRSEPIRDRNASGRGPKMATAIQFLKVNKEKNTMYDSAGGFADKIVQPVSGTMVALGRGSTSIDRRNKSWRDINAPTTIYTPTPRNDSK